MERCSVAYAKDVTKSIWLHANQESGLEAHLDAALDLVRLFDGHLSKQEPVTVRAASWTATVGAVRSGPS